VPAYFVSFQFNFFFFEIFTVSAPGTAGTSTGGAVTQKPGSAWLQGTSAISIILMFCSFPFFLSFFIFEDPT